MSDYRICTLNKDNHITGIERIACPTDGCALGRAAELADKNRAVEVWNLDRFVGRIAPHDRPHCHRRSRVRERKPTSIGRRRASWVRRGSRLIREGRGPKWVASRPRVR
jgi:hypothetical protein